MESTEFQQTHEFNSHMRHSVVDVIASLSRGDPRSLRHSISPEIQLYPFHFLGCTKGKASIPGRHLLGKPLVRSMLYLTTRHREKELYTCHTIKVQQELTVALLLNYRKCGTKIPFYFSRMVL